VKNKFKKSLKTFNFETSRGSFVDVLYIYLTIERYEAGGWLSYCTSTTKHKTVIQYILFGRTWHILYNKIKPVRRSLWRSSWFPSPVILQFREKIYIITNIIDIGNIITSIDMLLGRSPSSGAHR
jgi:hypothetical protein